MRAPRRAPLSALVVACGALSIAACTTTLQTLAVLPELDAGPADPPEAGDPDGGPPDANIPPGAIWNEWVPPKPMLAPIVRPSARTLATMVYDPNHSVLTLFGGCSTADCLRPTDMLDDTWEWTTGEKWLSESSETSPYPRIYTAMVFASPLVTDPNNPPQTFLFGGNGCSNPACAGGRAPRKDTWTWNSRTWVQFPTTASPPARSAHAMAYDPVRETVVLFGGLGSTRTPLDDTWELQGNTWVEMNPAHRPPARVGHAMTYDAVRGVTVLFGGDVCADQNCAGALLVSGDTWTWNGTDWTLASPAAEPPARSMHSLVYDSTAGVSILFGGADALTHNLNDTWEWNGLNWIQLYPVDYPLPRSEQAMAYDVFLKQTVMFGGLDTVGVTPAVWDDLWTLSIFP